MDLWTKLVEGDGRAYSILYDNYHSFLFNYGMKIWDDEDDVLDGIQDLFIYIYEKRITLSVPQSIKSYLCVSLRRILFQKKRYRCFFDNLQVSELHNKESIKSLDLNMEQIIVNNELELEINLKLNKTLSFISPQQREVIYLKYYLNLSNGEISKILNIDNQIVRNVSSRALSRMKTILNRNI